MNISLPFKSSENEQESGSGSDVSTEGTSTFVLTPVVSSLLSSKVHTLSSLLVIVSAIALINSIGMTTVIMITAAVTVYAISISSFEFGQTGDLEPNYYEHSILLVVTALAIPITVGVSYVGFQFGGGTISSASTGFLALTGWYVNRQVYNSMKEDERDLGVNPSKLWMYVTRVPYVAVIATAVVSTVPFSVWTGVTGFLVFTGFTYGMVRLMTFEEETVQAANHSSTPTPPTPEPDNIDEEVTVTDEETGEETTAEEVVEDTEIEEPLPDPKNLQNNFEKAKDVTMSIKESVERVNALLDDREMERQKLPNVTGENIPPDTDRATNLFNETQKLAQFLENYYSEDKELRMEVIEVQQNLQELDEFIYTEIGTSPERYK